MQRSISDELINFVRKLDLDKVNIDSNIELDADCFHFLEVFFRIIFQNNERYKEEQAMLARGINYNPIMPQDVIEEFGHIKTPIELFREQLAIPNDTPYKYILFANRSTTKFKSEGEQIIDIIHLTPKVLKLLKILLLLFNIFYEDEYEFESKNTDPKRKKKDEKLSLRIFSPILVLRRRYSGDTFEVRENLNYWLLNYAGTAYNGNIGDDERRAIEIAYNNMPNFEFIRGVFHNVMIQYNALRRTGSSQIWSNSENMANSARTLTNNLAAETQRQIQAQVPPPLPPLPGQQQLQIPRPPPTYNFNNIPSSTSVNIIPAEQDPNHPFNRTSENIIITNPVTDYFNTILESEISDMPHDMERYTYGITEQNINAAFAAREYYSGDLKIIMYNVINSYNKSNNINVRAKLLRILKYIELILIDRGYQITSYQQNTQLYYDIRDVDVEERKKAYELQQINERIEQERIKLATAETLANEMIGDALTVQIEENPTKTLQQNILGALLLVRELDLKGYPGIGDIPGAFESIMNNINLEIANIVNYLASVVPDPTHIFRGSPAVVGAVATRSDIGYNNLFKSLIIGTLMTTVMGFTYSYFYDYSASIEPTGLNEINNKIESLSFVNNLSNMAYDLSVYPYKMLKLQEYIVSNTPDFIYTNAIDPILQSSIISNKWVSIASALIVSQYIAYATGRYIPEYGAGTSLSTKVILFGGALYGAERLTNYDGTISTIGNNIIQAGKVGINGVSNIVNTTSQIVDTIEQGVEIISTQVENTTQDLSQTTKTIGRNAIILVGVVVGGFILYKILSPGPEKVHKLHVTHEGKVKAKVKNNNQSNIL